MSAIPALNRLEAGGCSVQSQHGLHGETLSQNKQKSEWINRHTYSKLKTNELVIYVAYIRKSHGPDEFTGELKYLKKT
jgi:hypothetical protein